MHRTIAKLPADYLLIDNALFQSNGHSTQIDHIVVSPYGVFVIETKGYVGMITGGEFAEHWTQNLYGYKYRFYNPILQNQGHVRFLKYLFKEAGIEVPIIPIVVFDNGAKICVQIQEHNVVYRRHLIEKIMSYRDVLVSEYFKQRVYDLLLSRMQTSMEAEREHISLARSKKEENRSKIYRGICPRCGGNLVFRDGNYGQFLGCSNYPKCRFTEKV